MASFTPTELDSDDSEFDSNDDSAMMRPISRRRCRPTVAEQATSWKGITGPGGRATIFLIRG